MLKNKKGFLLSESLVVATILLTALVIIYAQYARTYIKIKQTKNYNTKESMYLAEQITDYLKTGEYADTLVTCLGNSSIKTLTDCTDIPGLSELTNGLGVNAYVASYANLNSNLAADAPWNNYMKYLQLKLKVNGQASCVTDSVFIFVKSNEGEYGYANLKFNVFTESALAGNDPVIEGTNLVPIKFDGLKWVVANTRAEWYRYGSKRWANAVALVDEPTKSYCEYLKSPGTEIAAADIKGYMVYIPRYQYKIAKGGTCNNTPVAVDIQFVPTTTIGGDNNMCSNAYYVHPAFTWNTPTNLAAGTTQKKGFWVGKFETTAGTGVATILPGATSLGDQSMKTQYDNALLFSSDSYMAKNIEWGAVLFLSHSNYGQAANIAYNQTTMAGGGSSNAYITNITQSTTGNEYGVYDMAGGLYEQVMSFYQASGEALLPAGNISGFGTTLPSRSDRYEAYAFNIKYLKGDGVYEMKNWYGKINVYIGDLADNKFYFPYLRGGVRTAAEVDTGITSYSRSQQSGAATSLMGYRIVKEAK